MLTDTGRLFDMRDFHQRILELGPAPLSILEEYIDDWIQTTLAAVGSAPAGCAHTLWGIVLTQVLILVYWAS